LSLWVKALQAAILGAIDGARTAWAQATSGGENMDDKKEASDTLKRRAAWFRYFRWWGRGQTYLSIFIAGGSALVASKAVAGINFEVGRHEFEFASLVALVVAICAAIQNVLQPDVRARAYREAWVILDLAVKGEDKVSEPVIDAIRRGEERIGQRPISPSKPT
jgi:hypothetical protein